MSRVSWPLVLACLVVALILVDIGLVETNRSLQAEVSQRAQYIQQTAQIETLSREVVTALANLAIQNNDDQPSTASRSIPRRPEGPRSLPPSRRGPSDDRQLAAGD
jgi:hypothetical protein